MTILAHLGNQNAWVTPLPFCELFCQSANLLDLLVLAIFRLVHTGNSADRSLVTGEYFFEGKGNLAKGSASAGGIERQCKHVALPALSAARERLKSTVHLRVVALALELAQSFELRLADRSVVDLAHLEFFGFLQAQHIDTDYGFLAGIDVCLTSGRGLFDAQFREAGLNRFGHSTERLNFL